MYYICWHLIKRGISNQYLYCNVIKKARCFKIDTSKLVKSLKNLIRYDLKTIVDSLAKVLFSLLTYRQSAVITIRSYWSLNQYIYISYRILLLMIYSNKLMTHLLWSSSKTTIDFFRSLWFTDSNVFRSIGYDCFP
jgi:hypothetical protein